MNESFRNPQTFVLHRSMGMQTGRWIMRNLVIAGATSLSVASVLMFASGSFFIGHAQQADSRSAYVLFDTSPVVLKNVRVIEGTGAPAKEEQTIVIEDGRIRTIGDTDKLLAPATGRSVDLRGRTVLPGLVMVHEHFQYLTDINKCLVASDRRPPGPLGQRPSRAGRGSQTRGRTGLLPASRCVWSARRQEAAAAARLRGAG